MNQNQGLDEGGAPLLVSILTIGICGGTFAFPPVHYCPSPDSWAEELERKGYLQVRRAVIEKIETHHSKHIAAALGRDDGDAAIISRALSLAKAENALLTLIHVADSAPAQVYHDEVYDEHTREDEQYLLEIAAEVRASGVAVEVALPHGDPSTELISFAESHGVDMLVMGSHGHRLIGDLFMGTNGPLRYGTRLGSRFWWYDKGEKLLINQHLLLGPL